MKLSSKIKNRRTIFLICVVVIAGLTVSSLTLASSSANIMRFIGMTATQSRDAEKAVMRALRGEIVAEESTIELGPTTLNGTMLEILRANEEAAGGGISLEDVSELVTVGDGP